MIYILDDTVSQRKNEIQYLQNMPYSKECTLIEEPTMKLIKDTVLQDFSKEGKHLLCIHKSLKFFNENHSVLSNSEKLKDNVILNAKEKGIFCIEFSGGIIFPGNKEQLQINKNLFYQNLKPFLDKWIEGELVVDILYDGVRYKNAERKRLLTEIISLINRESSKIDDDLIQDAQLTQLLSQFFQENNPQSIVKSWINKKMTKKEIRQFINDNLSLS